MASAYISRDNMLSFCRAFGENFQRHYPIIHMQTFKLVDAKPALLLAVMLGGSCGANGQFSSSFVAKVAIQTLMLIKVRSYFNMPFLTLFSTRLRWKSHLCRQFRRA